MNSNNNINNGLLNGIGLLRKKKIIIIIGYLFNSPVKWIILIIILYNFQ